MDARISFYKRTIDELIKDRCVKILIVGGWENDKEVMLELGFDNVTISNLNETVQGNEFLPFKWSYQDAENLLFEDESFDYVVVHAVLHHCYSPHRALLEMYRVAKRGVIIFESRDSLIMKIIISLGLTQTYEHAAVYGNSCKYGGVKNTDIPNYVYRWTESEIEKTIKSYAPYAPHRFYYRYAHDAPRYGKRIKKGSLKVAFVYLLKPFFSLYSIIFPKQQNLFSCYIQKPDLQKDHFEWLIYKDGKLSFNRTWAENHYKKA